MFTKVNIRFQLMRFNSIYLPMNQQMQLQFSSMVHQLADGLGVGQASFDRDLNVIDMTSRAKEMIYAEPQVDKALARGTEGEIRNQWRELLLSSLRANQKAYFKRIAYWGLRGKQLLDITCVPITKCGQAQSIGGILVFDDITGTLDSAHEAAQSERLMAIGRVAGKVAHELNNPLDGILRYANLSLRILEQGQPDKAIEYIQHCRSGLQRMAQIITEMLEFSRSSHFVVENSPVDKLLEDAMRALDASLKSVDVRLVRKDTGPLPHFKSDALFQVFCNLLKNAADAMDGKGVLTITIGRQETGLQIDFEDTGRGFSPHAAEDLFKPFFTTKAPGRGTGLGLSICRDILEKFGGTINAKNLAQGGACFSVRLPLPSSPSSSVRS